MNRLILSISILFLVISCDESENEFQVEVLIDKIISLEPANEELKILDFHQGRFEQEIANDTLFVSFNGLGIGCIVNINDSLLYEIPDNSTIPFFCNQGTLKLSKKATIKLPSIVTNSIDSIDGIGSVQERNVFNLNWKSSLIPQKGFVIYSKPILNKKGSGLIAQMIYREEHFELRIYQFENFGDSNINLLIKSKYSVLSYEIETKEEEIQFIKPDIMIFQGNE